MNQPRKFGCRDMNLDLQIIHRYWTEQGCRASSRGSRDWGCATYTTVKASSQFFHASLPATVGTQPIADHRFPYPALSQLHC